MHKNRIGGLRTCGFGRYVLIRINVPSGFVCRVNARVVSCSGESRLVRSVGWSRNIFIHGSDAVGHACCGRLIVRIFFSRDG